MSFVPLSSTTPLNQYTATAGQTTFAYTWLAFAEADIQVYVNDVLKTLTTDYTISAVNDEDGGNVIFNSGLTVGDAVTISRSIEIERTTGFVEAGGSIKPAALNVELNRILAIQQDNKRDQNRTLSLTTSDPTTGAMVIPTKADRLGMLLGFHSTTGVPTAIDPETLSPDLTAAIASAVAAQVAAEAAQAAAEAVLADVVAYPIPPWATGTVYGLGQTVIESDTIYLCNTAHTAGATFAGDAAKWTALTTGLTASAYVQSLMGAADEATLYGLLNFGNGVKLNTGTSENNLVKLLAGGKLPAVSGENLTNLPTPGLPAAWTYTFVSRVATINYHQALRGETVDGSIHIPILRAGTLTALAVTTLAGAGDHTYTIYKNGSATSLTVTINGNGSGTDVVHSVSVTGGDYITLVPNVGCTMDATLTFTPTA